MIEDFKPFKALVESDDKLKFGGDWQDYAPIEAPQPFLQLDSFCKPMYNALLVVGVRRTGSEMMGGIEFLLQNARQCGQTFCSCWP